MESAIRLLLFCVLVILLPGCSGVTPVNIQDQPHTLSTPDPDLFRPGDVVLTISNDPSSWLLSLLGNPDMAELEHAYTHGEMVFVNTDGTKMLGGFSGRVMFQSLAERLPVFQKVVVLRPRKPDMVRYRLAAKMAKLTHAADYRKASFDYTFRDVPGRTEKFYCLGLINEVFRQVGEPVPFPHRPLHENNLIRHVESLTGYKMSDAPVVQDIVENPDFQVVLEWNNGRYDETDAWFNEHIARYTLDAYEEGWQLKPSDEIAVSMFLWLVDDGTFVELKKTLRSFQNFSSAVASEWHSYELEDEFDSLDEPSKIRALQRFAARYRDEYFVKSNQQGVRVAFGR